MQLASVEDAWEELDEYISDDMWDKFIMMCPQKVRLFIGSCEKISVNSFFL